MRLFNYRIVKRSNPWMGTKYFIQKRFFLLPFWKDLCFEEVFSHPWNSFENIEAARKELHCHESVWKDEVVE